MGFNISYQCFIQPVFVLTTMVRIVRNKAEDRGKTTDSDLLIHYTPVEPPNVSRLKRSNTQLTGSNASHCISYICGRQARQNRRCPLNSVLKYS